MRRTLTVLVASAALLVPASAASAAQPVDGLKVKTNASCNSGEQRGPSGFGYNGGGNYDEAIQGIGCSGVAVTPKPKPEPEPEPVDPCDDNPYGVDANGDPCPWF